ncbi:MAG: hypothetical protein LUF00_09765 [Lachnospiraceae bacterium]|nr:hypothetical protein [Lachnospiraceae bacterium]
MLYTPSDIWFVLLICLIIYLYERRKKNKEEEKRALEREKWARLHREREQREREEEAEREERMRRYRESLKTVLIYLTEEEMKKERFCQKRSGDIVISHNAIYMLYQVLHQKGVEKQEILNLLGDRTKKHLAAITMDADDQNRMEFCKEWLGVGEEEAYAIGIELYRQYLTQDDE